MTAAPPAPARARPPRSAGRRVGAAIRAVPLAIPLVLVIAALAFTVPSFTTATNVENVLYTAAILVLPGLAMTLCITMGEFDLSVGSTVALSGAGTCMAIVAGVPTPLALLLGLLIGALVGLFNGIVIAKLGVTAFIATLATMVIVRGFVQALTGSRDVLVDDPLLKYLAAGRPFGIPFPILLAVVAIAGFLWVTYRTRFGRHVAAVGSNREAAVLSGLPVDRIRMTVYVVVGVSAGVWGLIVAGQLQKGSPIVGFGFELDAITVVVIGGTALAGGRASIVGTVLGALLVVIIQNGLNLLNVPPAFQHISVGILLVGALAIQAIRRRRPTTGGAS